MPDSSAVQRITSSAGVRVYRIACPVLPHLMGCVHVVLGAGHPTLMDTGGGSPECSQAILQGFERIASEHGETICIEKIERILLTHGHLDHIGGAADFVDRSGAELMIHVRDLAMIADFDQRAKKATEAFSRFLLTTGLADESVPRVIGRFGYGPGRVKSVPQTKSFEDGEDFDGILAIHTPGHSAGHVCFRIDDLLLTGDHILAKTIPQQWPLSVAPGTGVARYIESVERVKRLEGLRLFLPSHETLIEDPAKRLAMLLRFQRRRMERVLDVLRCAPQPMTVAEIVRRVYLTQDGPHALPAFTDIGARIEYFLDCGLVRETVVDGVAHIEATEGDVSHPAFLA
jgi:glyoxylase-like metal-dependent hydrolase (beta-lactamase superfamily II)